MTMVEVSPAPRPRGPWRALRAPVLGVVLGLLLVKGVGAWRRARMSTEERRDAARAHCERAQEIHDEACRRLNVAPIYLPKDVMGEMIAEYTEALDLDPGCLAALDGRAYWLWFRGDLREALADYDELLRREPRDSLAWYRRGRLRCDLGDHAGAIADYTRSLEVEPYRTGSAVLGARSLCRRETGDWRGALADLVAEGGYDRLRMAECHQELGEHAAALPLLDAYLSASTNPEAFYRRGVSRVETGDRDGAVADFRRAVENDDGLRQEAQAFVAKEPAHPRAAALREALVPRPERER